MAIKELSWHSSRQVKLQKKPSIKEIFAYRTEIDSWIEATLDWYEDSSDKTAQSRLDKCSAVMRALFGLDIYEGTVYRVVPEVKPFNKMVTENTVLKFNVSEKRLLSSWTSSLSNAISFGNSNSYDYGSYIVIQLEDTKKVQQVASTEYTWLMVEYLRKTIRDWLRHDAPALLEKSKNKSLAKGYIHDLKYLLPGLTGVTIKLDKFKKEDEIILKIQPGVKVRVVAIVNSGRRIR